MLRNFLIHLFGGFTFDELNSRVAAARGDYKEERAYFTEIFEKKDVILRERDQEIRRLTDLMLTEHGVIQRDLKLVDNSERKFLPISGRKRWQQTRAELEKKDHAKAAEQTAEYWRKKNAGQNS